MQGKLDKGTLYPNVSVVQQIVKKTIVALSNPWVAFTQFGLTNLLNMVARQEQILHPSGDCNKLRESLANLEGIGKSGVAATVEGNIVQSPPGFILSATSEAVRERSRYQVPLTLLVWVTGFCLAFTDEWRTEFKIQANELYIPVFYSELFKRTRSGFCGPNRIVLNLAISAGREFVKQNPDFKNTFYDPDFLLSRAGIRSLLTLLQTLQRSPANYIPMVICNSVTCPNPASAYTITATAISCFIDPNFDITRADVALIAGNAYGDKIIAAHIGDAVLTQQVLVGESSKTDKDRMSSNASIVANQMVFETSGSLGSFAGYIVGRVLGIEPNSPGAPQDGQPNKDVGSTDTAPTPQPSGRGQRGRGRGQYDGGRGSGRRGYNRDDKGKGLGITKDDFIRLADEFIQYLFVSQGYKHKVRLVVA